MKHKLTDLKSLRTEHRRIAEFPPVLEMAKEAFGVRRMMWGSDFPPCSAREGYGNTIEGIREYPGLNDEDLKWILGETARRFWRLDGR